MEGKTAIDAAVVSLDQGAQVGMAFGLAFMMFAVALGLRKQDFIFLREHPRSVLTGLAAQVIGLPALTLLLIYIIQPMAGIALGMIVIACCPGGNVSNLFTRLSRGNAAYSVTLTTCSSIIAAFIVPISILFWTALYEPTRVLVDEIAIDRTKFIISTTVTLLLPLMLGFWISNHKPMLAAQLRKIFMPIAILVLIALVVFGLTGNAGLLRDFGDVILPIVVTHNLLAFLMGALVGRFGLRNTSMRRALVFEVGIQNGGLGLLIVLSQFGGIGSGAMIIATWSVWHLIGGLMLVGLFRLIDTQKQSNTLVEETGNGL